MRASNQLLVCKPRAYRAAVPYTFFIRSMFVFLFPNIMFVFSKIVFLFLQELRFQVCKHVWELNVVEMYLRWPLINS